MIINHHSSNLEAPRVLLRRGRGYGLLEIALGIAIAALLVAGAMMYFQNASSSRRAKETVEIVAAILSVTHSLYAGQPDYVGLTPEVLAGSSQLPQKFRRGAALVNPFGGALDIWSTHDAGRSWRIRINGLPKDACTYLATKDFGTAVDRILVNEDATGFSQAVTPSAASQACYKPKNYIVYTFR